jgi:PAS domain S-box-containing protein
MAKEKKIQLQKDDLPVSAIDKAQTLKFANTYPAYILLVILLVISYFVFRNVNESVVDARKNQFDKASTSVMTRFQQSYSSHVQVMMSIRGLYDNLPQVVRDYFMLYSSVPLKTLPSIISMMSVQRVRTENIVFYRHYVQSQGYFYYDISPQAPETKEYYPSEFIFPEATNQHIHGLDLNSVPQLHNIIEKSKHKTDLITTEAFILRKPDTLSLFLVSSVFKNSAPLFPFDIPKDSLNQLVVMEINGNRFFTEALGKGVATDTTIFFECYQNVDGKKVEIFQSDNYKANSGGFIPILSDERILSFADKGITVKFATVQNFGGSFQNYLPFVALLVSLIISLALFGFVMSVTITRSKAQELAGKLTKAQRRIMESSSDIIAVMTLDGIWNNMNHASVRIFGLEPENMVGQNFKELFVNESDYRIFCDFKNNVQDESAERFDFQMKDYGGEVKWINWNITVSPLEKVIYAIGRDDTLEKLAEEQNKVKIRQIQVAEQLSNEASEFKSMFLSNLSTRFKSSLSKIIDFQQKVINQQYQNEDEKDEYLSNSFEKSQELYTNISDMVDVAISTEKVGFDMRNLSIGDIVKASHNLVKIDHDFKADINLHIIEECDKKIVHSDFDSLVQAFALMFKALSGGSSISKIELTATVNPYENNVEIILQGQPDADVSEKIDFYKEHQNDIVSSLTEDINDIVLNLALSSSMIRTVGSTMSIDTFGRDDNNIIIVTIAAETN